MSENSYIIILQKELKDLIQQNEKLKVKRHTLSAQQILQMNFINEVNNIDLHHHIFLVCYVLWDIFVVQTKYDFWCPIKLPKIRDGNPKVKFFGNGNVLYYFLLFYCNDNNMCDNLMWFAFVVNVWKLLDHLSNTKDVIFLFQAIKVIANLIVACFIM